MAVLLIEVKVNENQANLLDAFLPEVPCYSKGLLFGSFPLN